MGAVKIRRRRSDTEVTVVILGGGRGTRLAPLTRLRSKPAVPLSGQYRLIDVPISNALNSGFYRMFILTQFNSVSLHRHVNSTFTFSPFSRGFVDVLAAQQTPGDETWFQGTADAVRQNLPFITEPRSRHVLILAGDHLYRCDYSLMLREHLRSDADVTVAVLPCSEAEVAGFGAVRVDGTGRIIEFREKPATPEARAGMAVPAELCAERGVSEERPYLASMGIYLFRKARLVECLESGHRDFGDDVLPAAVRDLRVQSYFFDGYWRDIGTIRAFYEAHMDLVRPKMPPFDFNDPKWTIYTRPRYLPPSRVAGTHLDRSILTSGCSVRDSTIEHSIVGLRSRISGATVRNTLVMGADIHYPDVPRRSPHVGIGDGSRIENAIVDKNARIGRRVKLVNEAGVQEAEGDGWVIRDGIIVVPKNAIIPDGTEV